MSKFIIEGGYPLSGTFTVSGMKNAATPLIAASLLLDAPVIFENVPDIVDVARMLNLVSSCGIEVIRKGSQVTLSPKEGNVIDLISDDVKRLRSSILLVGPLLARFGKVVISQPGGCYIGNRPLDTHIDMFRQLGVDVRNDGPDKIIFTKKHAPQSRVILSEFSVSATENALLFGALQEEPITISMAACEPHVQDVCNFLVAAGAHIEGIGTHTLHITGAKKLTCERWSIIPDQIEIGTLAVAAACVKGDVTLAPIIPEHLDALLNKFKEIGVPFSLSDSTLTVGHAKQYKNFKLQTLPYPGFPTDLQAPMGVLATQCSGLSLIHDPMFDGRFSYVQELTRMGAQAVVCDPHRVLFTGPTKLYGEKIKSFDLRAGATLIIAGLCAEGQTVIEDAEMVDRGYEHIEKRLAALGAHITRSNDV